MSTCRVLLEVKHERERQDAKWGEQNHDPYLWLTILGEEFGEACRGAFEYLHLGNGGLASYRKELIEVAAVAVAAVESLDRQMRGEGGDDAGGTAARD